MSNDKQAPKGEEKKEQPDLKEEPKEVPKRRIVIETDGSNINLVENQTAGVLELSAVLQTILAKLTQQK